MHVRRTMKIRNPDRPGKEVLPCRLTTEELRPRWQRVAALRKQRVDVAAELAAVKAKAKAKLDELGEEEAAVWRQIQSESEDRQVDVEYLVDEAEGFVYARRLDTSELVRRRKFSKREREDAKQGKLFDFDGPTRTVDVPEEIQTVLRFDVDTSDVGDDAEEEEEQDGSDRPGDEQHECTFDDGACLVCGIEEPLPDAVPPKRRKKGRGYDDRGSGVEAH